MSFFVSYSCGVISMLILTSTLAYQFDVNDISLYEDPARTGPRGSYFGYTVALWNPGNTGSSESWIFIGAPRANSSKYPGVREPGTVFKCNIGKQCTEWVVISAKSKRPTDGSWLGGTMNIENKKKKPKIVACASRWTVEDEEGNVRMPGSCYHANVLETLRYKKSTGIHLQPLYDISSITDSKGYVGELGQSGFSIHLVPGTKVLELMLGCPGVSEWHGTQISCRIDQSCSIPTPVEPTFETPHYSGYAVTSGVYFEDGKRRYATGAPRGESLCGKVLLFKQFPEEDVTLGNTAIKLRGEYIGEYFGAALASCDIDGDGKDDLLVGAPQWTKTLDEGRVYSFRGSRGTNGMDPYQFKTRNQFEGETPRGRFGSTITCLGDIDYDGYADVAIGAPYDGNGAVYIFHGSENGLTSNPQKIAGPKATRGFGISISEPRDVDNNGYADIAVGAYLSGHVTLIRSKRVVTMAVHMKPNFIGEQLDFKAESFSVSVCSTYGGPYAPQELNVTKEIKIDEMHRRAEIEAEEKSWFAYEFSETLKLDTLESCQNFTIKITKTANMNYFKPLKLYVRQRLITSENNDTLVVGPYNDSGTDNYHISVEDALEIPFKIDCKNNTCQSNLSIEMTTNLEDGAGYVIGSTPPHLRLNVRVNNSGDNAYSAKAYVHIPGFIKILKQPSMCEKNRKNTTHIEITCEIGNPLERKQMANFSIDLDMFALSIDTTVIKFGAVTGTSSEDISIGGNQSELSVNSVIQADIGLAGETKMDWHSFIRTQKEQRLPNTIFRHIFKIISHGVTPVSEALLRISYPTHWVHADNEIEIVKLNETVGELDGNQFHCPSADEHPDIRSLSYDATTVTEWLIGENSSGSIPQWGKKFTKIDGKIYSASPDNRTLYINTTNPAVEWKTINCIIGPFKTARSVATVVLTFDLLLDNLTPQIMNEKDIIFFTTNGSTKITKPTNSIETVSNKPDVIMIGTMFTEMKREHQLARWVIPVSVSVGLLLLMLLITVLVKFGFFKRSKKLELEAKMRENEDVKPKVILETTSSTEALDHM